ncbi:DUF3885 domain-containing protein [Heyndrickxia oleronia]|uniref:DUF3885 domain-containing protein n=1 Tax=Heyndrickxia oleronia TaxID=38875 RepID=A0A8E2I3Y5_9BACI|nr:DUF3885 domain-containing protein [Heyndrickxia oleronia]MEC1374324.1 DUF3885 domain-containing protein [Heyndrickxia oleronia]OOP66287.1 hypothetical protein BWZ43_21760 [Heyndrickxia oleronia]QQZ07091.1 DUF3885 domain-containing protein [Heyndrickxia oleronia]
MQLNEFMHKNYPNLELRPPLFYSWDIGIRFELGVEWKRDYDYPNNPYILRCYKRAITLFESVHSPTEDIFVVIDVNDFVKGKNLKHQLKNFRLYVKKPLLFSLKYQELPYIFPEDDEEGTYKTHRFTLKCKTSDFKYVSLLKAICNQDMGLEPRIFHRVYFININRKTIFHVYDDRGCDLLATSSATIRDVYSRYNDWILDYDRPKIEKVFN